ncbi:MAG: hypothetical protein CMD02_06955 [Flavobacteriales bacterium]|nr:hypothetical protein [Flavobacteriales bacterium]|tara:strand:- start:1516 stop:1821 length:306 start_codon:yes stop_codon:yes gene_type:complete
MKTKLFLFALLVGFTFTSCQKCQDCEADYEFINGAQESDYDAAASLFGYSTWNEFFHSNDSLNTLNKEYCDEELDDIINFSEEFDDNEDGVNDMRIFYNCK